MCAPFSGADGDTWGGAGILGRSTCLREERLGLCTEIDSNAPFSVQVLFLLLWRLVGMGYCMLLFTAIELSPFCQIGSGALIGIPRPAGGAGKRAGASGSGIGRSALDLRQVGSQVVGEPAVSGAEGLRPGGLRVPHDPGPVIVGVEGHDPVVPDPELPRLSG